jgi:predicted  nucleic acid-binding Zn-ribbon protein
MADRLITLANELKDKITAKKTTINTNNAQLIQQVTGMNNVAEQILGKVGNLNTSAQTLQQNIDAQARQIAELTRELEETRQRHETKRGEIDAINTSLAEAQGRGAESEALKGQLQQLQTEADTSRQRIAELTQQIEQTSGTIQEMIGSIDAQQIEQGQTELTNLTTELGQHIDAINAALPAGAGGPPAMEAQGLPPPPPPPPPPSNEGDVESNAGLLEAPPGMGEQANGENIEPGLEENPNAATSLTGAQTRKNRSAPQNLTAKRGSSSAMRGLEMQGSETYEPTDKELFLMQNRNDNDPSNKGKRYREHREQAFKRVENNADWVKAHPEIMRIRGGKRTMKHRKGNKSRYSRKRAKIYFFYN